MQGENTAFFAAETVFQRGKEGVRAVLHDPAAVSAGDLLCLLKLPVYITKIMDQKDNSPVFVHPALLL